jgi:hypothetical protein
MNQAIQPQMLPDGSLLTGEFIGSFVHVLQMHQFSDNDPEYSVTMMFDPSDPTIGLMAQMIQAAIAAKWPAGAPPNVYTPILDGNIKAAKYPEMAGKYTVKAGSKTRKPLVLDRDKIEIMDPSQVYSGAKYRAMIDCFAYDKGSNGVAFSLKIIQKTADGAAFGASPPDPSLLPALQALPMAQPAAMPQQMMQHPQQGWPAQQPMPQQGWPVQQGMPQAQPMPMAQPAAMPQQYPQVAPAQPAAQPMPLGMPGQPVPQQVMPGQPAAGAGFVPAAGGVVDLNKF